MTSKLPLWLGCVCVMLGCTGSGGADSADVDAMASDGSSAPETSAVDADAGAATDALAVIDVEPDAAPDVAIAEVAAEVAADVAPDQDAAAPPDLICAAFQTTPPDPAALVAQPAKGGGQPEVFAATSSIDYCGQPATGQTLLPQEITTTTPCTASTSSVLCSAGVENSCGGYCAPDGFCHFQSGTDCSYGIGYYGVCQLDGECLVWQGTPGPFYSPLIVGHVTVQGNDNDQCVHGFLYHPYEGPPYAAAAALAFSAHPRDPTDDNPCTLDACSTCAGMSHTPQAGPCSVAGVCGACVAGSCDAVATPALFDFDYGVLFTTVRQLPDGGILTSQQSTAQQSGLARMDAMGNVQAQVWAATPLVLAAVPTGAGNPVAVLQTTGQTDQHCDAYVLDPVTLQPKCPPADSQSGCSMPRPVVFPGGAIVAEFFAPTFISEAYLPGPMALYQAGGAKSGIIVQTIPRMAGMPWLEGPLAKYGGWSSEVTPLTGNALGTSLETLGSCSNPSIAQTCMPEPKTIPDGILSIDGIAATPAGPYVTWGRGGEYPWPKVIALWLAADATSVTQIVTFDELPDAESDGQTAVHIAGLMLPDGGVAVQRGRAIAWTDAAGNKIGYALLPAAQQGLSIFATWPDGSLGLWGGGRIARIPWNWGAVTCK